MQGFKYWPKIKFSKVLCKIQLGKHGFQWLLDMDECSPTLFMWDACRLFQESDFEIKQTGWTASHSQWPGTSCFGSSCQSRREVLCKLTKIIFIPGRQALSHGISSQYIWATPSKS